MEAAHKQHSTNIELAKTSIEHLLSAGVHEFVLCSGNRNAPFIAVISSQDQAKVYHHFSEAAAAFFALGRIKAHGNPVAVVVTSGTAALQLGAAAVEAAYSKLPLVLVTADRPERYRGTAAPQSINQKNLFAANLNFSFDCAARASLPDSAQLSAIFEKGEPVHLNVCFEEPLIDLESDRWRPVANQPTARPPVSQVESPELKKFLAEHKSPVVVLGKIPLSCHSKAKDFLRNLGAPILAEGLSGFREDSDISDLQLESGDAILRKGGFDSLIRIGSVPTLGFWRDLERSPSFAELPVLSITQDGFSGLARPSTVIDLLSTALNRPTASQRSKLLDEDQARRARLENLLLELPKSEPALFRDLSEIIEGDALVYIGNSMPIRLWDLAASRRPNNRVIEANRGVNGIDGQLSSFFGAARTDRANWCILGDLTTLYDLEAPYILEQLPPELSARIVIVNNEGGRIFELLPDYQTHFRDSAGGRAFIQPCSVDFQRFAELWNLDFMRSTSVPRLESIPARGIIELRPDLEQTREFWNSYRALMK